MGLRFSKLKPSTMETLERLEQEMKDLEELQADADLRRRHYVGYLFIFSVVLYFTFAVFSYFYWKPVTTLDIFLRIIPFILFPVFAAFARYLIIWLYTVQIERSQQRWSRLSKKRQKILDEVKTTETYKVAMEILNRFDPQSKFTLRPDIINRASAPQSPQDEDESRGLRKRRVTLDHVPAHRVVSNPAPIPPPVRFSPTRPRTSSIGSVREVPPDPASMPPWVPRLPRPVLPRERSAVDKLVDYILGDGQANRYALICSNCHGHNGMALQEEFEFLAFRCCYCFSFNPARKMKEVQPAEGEGDLQASRLDTRIEESKEEESHETHEDSHPQDELLPTPPSFPSDSDQIST